MCCKRTGNPFLRLPATGTHNGDLPRLLFLAALDEGVVHCTVEPLTAPPAPMKPVLNSAERQEQRAAEK